MYCMGKSLGSSSKESLLEFCLPRVYLNLHNTNAKI